MSMLASLIVLTLGYSTTLLFGSVGEIITEKSGNLNLGTPGIMCLGGVFSVLGAYVYTSWFPFHPVTAILFPLLFAIAGSLLATLIYGFLTISLKANQNVTGLALTTFGIGMSNFIGGLINNQAAGNSGVSAFPEVA